MIKRRFRWRYFWLISLMILMLVGTWLLNSQNPDIFPVRNVMRYNVDRWWYERFGEPVDAGVGSVAGCVTGQHRPIVDGHVLFAQRNGILHHARTDATGCYQLANLPAGRYTPVITAAGWSDASMKLDIMPAQTARFDATLQPYVAPLVTAPTRFEVGEPVTLTVPLPKPSVAVRRDVRIWSDHGEHQQTLLYTPITATTTLPTLLAVYPGKADTWENVSIPLAAQGYTVLAIGPEYTMDFEGDIADLKRMVMLLRSGTIPFADGSRVSLVAGSYSIFHVLRLLRDDVGFRSAIFLGPISDLFDMRKRYEVDGLVPPFGLDQALIALGYPNVETQRYVTYSARFHGRSDLPPILLMHSNHDEIVPAEQSHDLVAEFERLNVSTEAYFFDGMAHYLQTNEPSAELDQLYAITLNFLARTMGK